MSFFKASAELKETVRKLYPELVGLEDVKFIPTLEFGDATTDVPQRIGKQYHIAPSEVTKKIIANLPTDFPGECRGVRDFLNVTLNSVAENWKDGRSVFSGCNDKLPEKIAIVLPKLLKTAPKDEYFRLSALAFLQLLLAKKVGVTMSLYLGRDEIARSDSFSLAELFKRMMNEISSSVEAEIVSDLQGVIANAAYDRVVLWLAPSSLSKTVFNQLYHSHIKGSERVQLNCPERGYLAGVADFYGEDFSSYTERELAALLLHLASPKQGLDLEITTAKFSERENLLWLMESLYQRKRNLKPTPGSGVMPRDLSILTEREAELVKSAFFLDYFFRTGAYYGQVREYTDELQRFLMAFALYLSDPSLRMRWNELPQETVDILSGAEAVLSDTIASWCV